MTMSKDQKQMTADLAWNAVLSRDRSLDGELFYGVKTTGIYCRPSCPSRRPARKNAVFFDNQKQAEQAGFRACHRCQPNATGGTTTERRVRRAIEYLDQHVDQRITLETLGQKVGLSPFYLQRAFKEAVGVSPHAYQNARRLAAMKGQLKKGERVGRAVWSAGYGSARGAYESAASGLGMTPGQYRSGARGVSIHYALEHSQLGDLVVAWTPSGICAVMLGDSPEEAVANLKAEFPAAELALADAEASKWVRVVLAYAEGSIPGTVLPLDLRGTQFQLRVWQLLREIPVGEVRSYKDIASALGEPTAVRAVARAIATNKAALVVPCHRVIRADGSLSGYRWGVQRKQQLLDQERTRRENGSAR
jgi:AraC family transcriptional regulator of adaptative response/methylated-DNA-[protein]-cysteine methyltransferase